MAREDDMMARRDFAIVIGINLYEHSRELDELKGPRNDAEEFIRWLRQDYSLANLEEHNLIRRIESPDFSEIRIAVSALLHKIESSAGRRLYIFCAGHGFETTSRDAGVYTSDYIESMNGARWNLMRTANWLRDSGRFQEVIVFMDCCRTIDSHPADEIVPEMPTVAQPASYFYCLSCGPGGSSGEKEFNGKTRGIFSFNLIEALDGKVKVAVDAQGQVTAHSLRRHLKNLKTPHFVPPDNGEALRRLVLATGFERNVSRFEVKLTDSEKRFGLYSGSPVERLNWPIEKTEEGRIFVQREDEDLAVIVTIPANPPFERKAAVFPEDSVITI
jgi:hypothetical protein